jgi:hypothetical protein
MEEIFESSVRSSGDMAGVFEFDGETSYFYLYRVDANQEGKVLNAVKVFMDAVDCKQSDVVIKWSSDEKLVFLQLTGQIHAAFDCDNFQSYSGDDLLRIKSRLD